MPSINIDLIRSISWGRTDSWDIQFPGNPIPGFPGWIPAYNYTRPVATVAKKEVKAAFQLLLFPLPDENASPVIELDLLDDDQRNVLNWCVNWARQMSSQGVQQPLAQCVRQVQFQLLDRQKNVLNTWNDSVFLFGEYKLEGKSVAEIPSVHLKLALASALIAP